MTEELFRHIMYGLIILITHGIAYAIGCSSGMRWYREMMAEIDRTERELDL